MGVAIDKTAIVPSICHSISEHDLIAKVKQNAAINQSAEGTGFRRRTELSVRATVPPGLKSL
jgi:hypothetical protein